MLNSEHIRHMIKKIDDTKSALKFKILNQTMKEDKEIDEFIKVMLSEIGYLDSEGRFQGNE